MIKNFLFDLDDTIFSREDAFNGFLKIFVDDWFNSRDSWYRTEVVEKLKSWDERGFVNREHFLQKVLNNYPEIHLNLEVFVQYYWKNFVASIVPDKKANDFLKKLNQKNIPWGIVTNGDENQYLKIEKADLTEILPFIVVSDVFGIRKPKKEIFQYALEKLGVEKKTTLFVGDTIETDIIGAQNFGMKSAWVQHNRIWPDNLERPEFIISHITDLDILVE